MAIASSDMPASYAGYAHLRNNRQAGWRLDSAIIKHGEARAHIALMVPEDASPGNVSIEVTGQPSRGTDAPNEFDLTGGQYGGSVIQAVKGPCG
ncbi:MAG: hypothetical protein U1E05_16150 [Patescibacteria group bacterium]|nr:hypothetical protein [Patescibacteria group bacterium]